MIKRMLIMILLTGLVFGLIFGWHQFGKMMMMKGFAQPMPPATVATIKAQNVEWIPLIHAIGSVRAAREVEITSEVGGKVADINFNNGDSVKTGAILLHFDSGVEIAQLAALQIALDQAVKVNDRARKQLQDQSISQAEAEAAEAGLKSLQAQVDQQKAVLQKKQIHAPFAGKLGLSSINPGQYLNPGEKIVSLQDTDSLKVDIALPQQKFSTITVGQEAKITVDAWPGLSFKGTVGAVDPRVDPSTRNFRIEISLPNPDGKILPGMFVEVDLVMGKPQWQIVVPQTAITYNPYGETAFILETKTEETGQTVTIARQTFVTLGEQRGDQVAIVKGIPENAEVITAGQLKIKNGSKVKVNNDIQPSNDLNPNLEDK